MTAVHVVPTQLEVELSNVLAESFYDGDDPAVEYGPAQLAPIVANALAQHRARTLASPTPLVLPPAEPQPDAPTDVEALPDYWDERRRKQGKPDLSRCAAELRIALKGR